MERPGFDLIERATTVDELKEFEQEYSKDRGKWQFRWNLNSLQTDIIKITTITTAAKTLGR